MEENMNEEKMNCESKEFESVLRSQANWKELWFYQKSVVLSHLTNVFVHRFLPAHGTRTVDQMVQAARSGKQNIVEGSADGVASVDMEIKLLNTARGSIQELREDYEDFLGFNGLTRWGSGHSRYDAMLEYCRAHNKLEDYSPYFDKWSAEEMANVAITLSHMVDKMMTSYREKIEREFLAEGGIKERMTRARINYRNKKKEG